MSDALVLTPWREMTAADFRQWSQFAARCRASPDLQPEWSQALLDAHRVPQDEVSVVRFVKNSDLRLIWPLWAHRERHLGVSGKVVEPVTSIYALRQSVLSDLPTDETVTILLECLERTFTGWAEFRLRQLSDLAPATTAWREIGRRMGHRVTEQSGKRPPFMSLHGSWEEYLLTRSANFRSGLRRKTRKLASRTSFRLNFIRDASGAREALARIAVIEAHSWKQDAGTSMAVRPWETRFYELLADGLAPREQVVVTILEIEDRPAAYDLSVMGGGIAYCLKTSFDSAYADLSPGIVLRAALIQHLFDSGIREYDFLGDSERYKLEWATGSRTEVAMTLFNRRSLAGICAWLIARTKLMRPSVSAMKSARS